jgi:Fe-S-cluster containining protein
MAKQTTGSSAQLKRLLKKAHTQAVIQALPAIEEQVFKEVDCLTCARCCKNYSPRFKTPDIVRISKHLGLRQSDFIGQYLRLDEDNDYVTQTQPCPFLERDNTCRIYEQRPSDCARFPYIGEDILVKKAALTTKNAEFCPAVQRALELIEQKVG